MRMVDLIEKKKRGEPLEKEEIRFFTDGFTCGEIPDYQASALLMAICFVGMTAEETAALTTVWHIRAIRLRCRRFRV